jgi:protein CWC15
LNYCRKDGQDTTEDLRKRDLRDELEDRERHHFSSKERNYSGVYI